MTSTSNDDRNRVIGAVNGALHGLPAKIRSISADYCAPDLRLQLIHDGMIDEAVRTAADIIEERVVDAMPNARIKTDIVRVDAPGIYYEQLLSIVILAMFEQNEDAH